jgi:hypothetical protein
MPSHRLARGAFGGSIAAACFACLASFALLACSSPPPAPHDPSSSVAAAPFDAVQRTLAARGAGPEYRSFTVEERDSAYLRGFRERASASAELRELVFHGVFRPDHPKAAGALQVDEVYVARASDPKPYAEYDVAAMVELARLVKLRLRGVVDVKWFVHGEHDALVEVRATADATRFEFHRNRSGEAGEMPWHGLALDRDGVPARLE